MVCRCMAMVVQHANECAAADVAVAVAGIVPSVVGYGYGFDFEC